VTSDEPDLIPRGALAGVSVGLSVSTSSDLHRLGLTDRHAELAIGELTRAILIAGGTIAYGGRLRPSGFTQQLMHEVRRFGSARHSLTLYLAYSEHHELTDDDLLDVDRSLGTWGRLITLDPDGAPVPHQNRARVDDLTAAVRARALTGMRQRMTEEIDARVLVGGQLRNFKGSMPGMIEEALLATSQGQPVYYAGGFGGAAAAAGRRLDPSAYDWLPPGLPDGHDDGAVDAALERLESAASERGWNPDAAGLDHHGTRQLAASHRPGEIASLCTIGLAQLAERHSGTST
jgi:hypothetical protein